MPEPVSTLLFLITVISVLVLSVTILSNAFRLKSIKRSLKILPIIVASYGLFWLFFYFKSTNQAVPLGTDVCFDDWCASITKVENPTVLGNENRPVLPQGRFYVLRLRMSNHARGISQKPSEPRVHILDGNGYAFSYSGEGQQALERSLGKQAGIDHRLELHESLETQLVFDIPKEATGLVALIEEGPFITKFLFPDDRQVFAIR